VSAYVCYNDHDPCAQQDRGLPRAGSSSLPAYRPTQLLQMQLAVSNFVRGLRGTG